LKTNHLATLPFCHLAESRHDAARSGVAREHSSKPKIPNGYILDGLGMEIVGSNFGNLEM
jgi:hypothetical protein